MDAHNVMKFILINSFTDIVYAFDKLTHWIMFVSANIAIYDFVDEIAY